MTILSDYVSRMVDAGMDQDEAMQIAAEVFAAGAACAAVRPSKAALRTRKWRAGNKSPTVTSDAPRREEKIVTNHHQPSQVTLGDNPPLSIEDNKKEKKERVRASQVPNDWRPSDAAWTDAVFELGTADRAERELSKFKNNSLAKGATYKNFDAGWRNWFAKAVEWSGGKPAPAASGVVRPSETSWRPLMQSFKAFGTWPRGHGNEPGTPACRVPTDILREFGYG